MRLKNILLALALPVAVAGGVFAQQPDTLSYSAGMLPTAYYTDGVRLAVQEEMTAALGMFERALAIDPDHDPSLYEAANVLAALEETEKALEYSSRAVELDPANRWYAGQKARLLAVLERYDEAIVLYESMLGDGMGSGERSSARKGKDFDPDNYRMLAILYYHKGRADDALATLDSVEVRMGKTPEIIAMKRDVLIGAGRVEDAVRETEKYIAATPYDEENRLALAEMHAYRGEDSIAVQTLKEVLAINPDNTSALKDLSDLYLKKGQNSLFLATTKQIFMLDEVPLAQKLDQLDQLTRNTNFYRGHFMEIGDLALVLIAHYPGNPEVMEFYADHAVRSGDAEGSLTILKTQLDNSDPRLSTFMKIIEIEAYLGRADSVARYSDRALTLYPGEMDVYMLRSSALQYMGRAKEARKTLSRALKIAVTDSLRSEIHGAIGTLWHEEGNNRKTFAEYEKALRYSSNNALVLNNYAYFLAVEGRELDRALGMASRAVKLQENFATYLDTYAWVLYKTGNYAEAKKTMQQALPLDKTGSSELLIHYGDILWALNEEFMASVYWKKARDAGYEPVSEIEERLARIK